MQKIPFLVLLIFGINAIAELTTDPTRFTIKQRSSEVIPGLEPVRIHLGDITGGQVLVSVGDKVINNIMNSTSMKRGDVASFTIDDKTYYIKVLRLHNALVGEDFGELELSTKDPNEKLPPVKKHKSI